MQVRDDFHGSCFVEETAMIGQGTKIWHFSHIDDGARIGVDCSFGQNTYVGKFVEIGDRVKVQNNVSIWTGVTIQNNVFIGPNVTFTNITHPRALIDQKKNFAKTEIKNGATLGANCTLIAPLTVGFGAVVGAGAVVSKDVPHYCVVTGNPAKVIRGVYRYAVTKELVKSQINEIPKDTVVEARWYPQNGKWRVIPFPLPQNGSYVYVDEHVLQFIDVESLIFAHPEHASEVHYF